MKLFAVLSLLFTLNAEAVTYVRPTLPGTNADSLVRPGMAIDGDRIYQTLPGSDAEDLTKPGYIREGNTWVQTVPSSTARKAKGRNFNVYGSNRGSLSRPPSRKTTMPGTIGSRLKTI